MDLEHFLDARKEAILVCAADGSRHAAVFRENIAELIAGHAPFVGVGIDFGKVIPYDLVGFRAVEVVGVHHGKGLFDDVAGGQDRVAGAPGFLAAFGNLKSRRDVVEILEGVFHRQNMRVFVADFDAEFFLEVMSDHEDDLAEIGSDGVENGIVHDDFAGGAHRIDLLETAVTAAHAGRQNKKSRFHAFS